MIISKGFVLKSILVLLVVSFSLGVVVQVQASTIQTQVLDVLLDEGLLSQQQYEIRKSTLQGIDSESFLRKPAATIKTSNGSISGHIVDKNSDPISFHIVTLYSSTALSSPVATTQTDAAGFYQFTSLADGDFVLFTGTNNDGYLHYVWQTNVSGGPRLCHQCNNTIGVDNYINISNGAAVTNIDVTTQLGGVITGFIKDADTLAAVETLRAIAINISDTSYNLKFQFALTDTMTGEYRIVGIPNGTYKLFLEGRFDLNNEYIPQLYGGSQCNDCRDLAFANQGSDLVISNLNTITGTDFNANKGASISGKIVDAVSGNPLSSYALLLVFDQLNNLLTSHLVTGTNQQPSATGDYFIGGLLPGSYYLQGGDLGFDFYQREVYNNKPCYWSGCDRSTGDPLVLNGTQAVTNIDFLLEKGGKISGTITSSGVPITDANVQVQFLDANELVVGGAKVNANGNYLSARALPPGNYAVRTGNLFLGILTQPYVNEKYNDVVCSGLACDLTTADVNVAVNNTTTGIDFDLTTGLSFAGTITEFGTGNPIAGVHVLMYQDMGAGTVKFANWATTNDGSQGPVGSFEVSGLPAGTYYAVTNNGSNLPFAGFQPGNGDGWLDILYDSMICPATGCDILQGTPIVLTNSKATNTNFNMTLQQGANISGKITDDVLNSPISQIKVNVYNQNADYFGSYTTDAAGFYKTAGLPAGTYYLTTTSFDVLIDMKYGDTPCYTGTCNPLDAQALTLGNQQSIGNIDFVLIPTSDFVFMTGFE